MVSVEDVVETLLGLEIVDEVDHEHDMQAAARRQWSERAVRLGLVEAAERGAAVDQAERERQSAARLGITGGEPPAVTRTEADETPQTRR